MRLDLNVTCSYSVGLTLDIPDDVPHDIATKLVELYNAEDSVEIDIDRDSEGLGQVADWLNDHIRERDAYDWHFTIIEAKILPDNNEEGGDK